MKETNKFKTKKGRGATCYRIPRKEGGKAVFTKDFYRRIARGGRQFYFRLGPEKRQAEVISNEIDDFLKDPRNSIEQAILRFNPDSALRESGKTMISDVIRAHEKIEPLLELRPNVAKNYRKRLMWVVRRVNAYRRRKRMEDAMLYEDSVAACDLVPVASLNEKFISDLKMAIVSEADKGRAAQADIKRRITSVMADAKAIFSEAARREYHAMGLEIPDITPFIKAKLFNRVMQKRYRLPEPEVIKCIFKQSQDLRINPNAYRILLLALGSGLRRDEIQHVEWSWIENSASPRIFLQVTDSFEQKGKGDGYVDLCPWAYRRLCDVGGKRDGRVLTGTFTDGYDAGRYLCKWLRSRGLIRQKPIHELRMLYGSYVANRKGIFVAQKLLRHKDAQITSDHYADLIVDEDVLALWEQVA